MNKTCVTMTAIIAITFLEAYALKCGINGTMFSVSLVIIAGLAGLILPTPKFLKE